jgi:aminoglycoside phosphotransferase (APT) family kinase protein
MPIPTQRDLEQARKTLTGWVAGQLPGAIELELSEVTGPAFTGFSNETLMFDATWIAADGRPRQQGMVVRVKPTGHTVFLESEFEVQYRIMEILGRETDVAVPALIGFEEDATLLGAPFFVMDKVEGRIPTDDPPYHTGGWLTEVAPAERQSIWWSGLEAMARVHRLDWRQLGLEFLDKPARGRPGLEQQLRYYEEYFDWAKQGQANPVAEAALAWITANAPGRDEPVGLCWGDARIGNMIFQDGACVAVLDWEMVTLGNPVQDLAWWLFLDRHHSEGMSVERLAGFPSHADTVARWQELTGYDASPEMLVFYEIFAAFRFAVVMQRLGRMIIDSGLLPEDSDFGINNTVTTLLARSLERQT